ncbi:MAG: hypothetical protein UW24_C0016G0017 [Parcubacteria group bacterium GW2011_GWA2_44_12]|nr:MAG: hypothetical protein UW24_C0016G0017 [Parcubacteria group bacterium GW2011_GWA2_44_12]
MSSIRNFPRFNVIYDYIVVYLYKDVKKICVFDKGSKQT